MQLKLRISIVSGLYMTKSPVWRLQLSAELLWSAPSVRVDLEPFVWTINPVRVTTEIVVSGCRLQSAVADKWFCASVITDQGQTKGMV